MLEIDQSLEAILSFQINKEPVQDDLVRDGSGKKKVARKRRRHAAQMFDAMSEYQVMAFAEIGRAFKSMTSGMTMKIMKYDERVAGTSNQNAAEYEAALQITYMKWARQVQSDKALEHAFCIDVIAYGKTLGQVDAERRMRKGKAKQNLLACLNVWCAMKGWPVEKK